MKSTEFCYWLQGYFELNDILPSSTSLNRIQIVMISNHLELVRKVEGKLTDFPAWLSGVIDVLNTELEPDPKTLDSTTKLIREKLSKVFEHVIDKSYPGDQQVLNEAHSGGMRPPRPGGNIRC